MLFQATVIPVLHDAHVVNAMSLTILTAPAGTFWCGETVWTKNTYPESCLLTALHLTTCSPAFSNLRFKESTDFSR